MSHFVLLPHSGCPCRGPHHSEAILQRDPCPGPAVAQERSQGILRSLEEVSAHPRWVSSLRPLSSPCFHFAFLLTCLCLAGVDGNGTSPSKSELHRLYLTEKYVWRWKQFLSRRGKRTTPLDLKLGHNNWLRQVSTLHLPFSALLSCSPFTVVHVLSVEVLKCSPQEGQVSTAVLCCLCPDILPVPPERQTSACIYFPCCLLLLSSAILSLLQAKFSRINFSQALNPSTREAPGLHSQDYIVRPCLKPPPSLPLPSRIFFSVFCC